MKILFLDDQIGNHEVFEYLFIPSLKKVIDGLCYFSSSSIREGIEAMDGGIDIVISDVELGEKERGEDFYHEVRKIDKDVAFIFFSGAETIEVSCEDKNLYLCGKKDWGALKRIIVGIRC